MAEFEHVLEYSEMLRKLRISHILLEDGDWQKLETACDELGYDKSGIVKNIIQGFFKQHRDFYVNAGILDAKARGITSSQHFVILRDESEEDLPNYVESLPILDDMPLRTVPPLPLKADLKRKFNLINMPSFNYVLLRVAHIIHRDSYPQLLGKIARSHLAQHWEATYLPQIERNTKDDYI